MRSIETILEKVFAGSRPIFGLCAEGWNIKETGGIDGVLL